MSLLFIAEKKIAHDLSYKMTHRVARVERIFLPNVVSFFANDKLMYSHHNEFKRL